MLESPQKALQGLSAFLRANATALEQLPCHTFQGQPAKSALTLREWANAVDALSLPGVAIQTMPKQGEEFTSDAVQGAIKAFLMFGEQTAGTSHQGYFKQPGFAARALAWHLGQLEAASVRAEVATAS